METPDRLAAYLAGDLDPADATALEEELARDPALRAQLAAMRRADGALLALESPRPSEGFEDRLRSALEPVLAEELGSAHEEPAPTGTFDELAQRRTERDHRRGRWLPAVASVAAVAAAVVVITSVLPMGGDDSDMAMDETEDTGTDTSAEMETFDGGGDDDASGLADDAGAPPPPEGPTVVASGRELEQQELEELLAAPELEGVTAQGYAGDQAAAIAGGWSLALGAEPAQADAAEEQEGADADIEADGDGAEDSAADGSTLFESAPMQTRGSEPLAPEDEADVARCLEHITEDEDAPPAIPVYVELGTYQQTPVIVFGMVVEHPDTGAFTRPQLWVTDRTADCAVMDYRVGN